MKKTLLAAALAVGFAGVAQAETSVTLYGVVDTGITYQSEKKFDKIDNNVRKYTKRKRVGMSEGYLQGMQGSRWGLRGVEDLGNGLNVVFTLESGFHSPTATPHDPDRPLFNRQAFLGLTSDSWGAVYVGRQYTLNHAHVGAALAPFGASYGLANAMVYQGTAGGVRWDNAITYLTPNFNGFKAGLQYSFNTDGRQGFKDSGEKDPNERGFGAFIKYDSGPVAVALAYEQTKAGWNGLWNAPGNTDAKYGDTTRHYWGLTGTYDFEVVKVHAGFGQSRNGTWYTGGTAIGTDNAGILSNEGSLVKTHDKGFKANSYMLGLTAPVGNGTVMLEWGMMDPRTKSHRIRDIEKVNNVRVDMKKAQRYALGYNYSLSKRTNVYAVAAHEKNTGFVRGQKKTDVTVGLRHAF